MASIQKQIEERTKRTCRKSLCRWGNFLDDIGYQVKFHKHGGFTVKPPEYKTNK